MTQSSGRSFRGLMVVLVLMVSCPYYPSSKAWAVGPGSAGFGRQVLLYTGAGLCSVFYTPAKAVYAMGGGVAAGAVYCFSAGQSSKTAGRIFNRASGGDWFIRPEHLTKDQPVLFRGEEGYGRRSRR